MANKQINQYTAASTIDAVNDQLLIDPGGTGAYNKINRNTLLAITGAPIGTTDAQTLSNKTIGNTNSITILDGGLTIQNSSDATKQGLFSLAGNTTGTTRTYTLPNASVTLASLTGTETLTNKTLTAPTISGGTIDNTTITVDSVAGHTTSTVVTIANLQISNGVLNSANAVTATSIANAAVQPQALVAGTGSGWSLQSWTPTWTGLTVGNGTQANAFTQIGKTVVARISFKLGSISAVTGGITFTLPVPSVSSYINGQYIGAVRLVAAAAGFFGYIQWISSTTADITVIGTGSTYANDVNTSSSVPGVWANNDSITGTIVYEAA